MTVIFRRKRPRTFAAVLLIASWPSKLPPTMLPPTTRFRPRVYPLVDLPPDETKRLPRYPIRARCSHRAAGRGPEISKAWIGRGALGRCRYPNVEGGRRRVHTFGGREERSGCCFLPALWISYPSQSAPNIVPASGDRLERFAFGFVLTQAKAKCVGRSSVRIPLLSEPRVPWGRAGCCFASPSTAARRLAGRCRSRS